MRIPSEQFCIVFVLFFVVIFLQHNVRFIMDFGYSDKNVSYILSYLIFYFIYYKNCECTVDLYRFFESRTTNISLHINVARIYMQADNSVFFFVNINYSVVLLCVFFRASRKLS